MTGKRRRFSAEFKAQVALEAIWGELTIVWKIEAVGQAFDNIGAPWPDSNQHGVATNRF